MDGSWGRLRRIPIRLKLASALALPLAALAVVSVLELRDASHWVNELNRQADLARASIGPSGLVRSLQDERTWPAIELVGFTSVNVPVTGYDETRAATDEAIAAFREQVDGADESVKEAFAPAMAGLDALRQLRADIDGNTAPHDGLNIGFASQVFDRYTAVIEPFFAAAERVSLSVDGDAELRQGTDLANVTSRIIEVQSLVLAYTLSDSYLSPGGVNTSPEISRIASLQSEFQELADELSDPTGPFEEIAAERFPSELVDRTNEQVTTAIRTSTIDLASTMEAVTVPLDEGFVAYEQAVHKAVEARADELDGRAQRQRLLFGGLGLVALVSTVSLTLAVSRSITKPLRSLTQQAKVMASTGLPEAVLDVLETPLGEDVVVPDIAPIRVKTRDEVADVADALNTVQDSALDLAVEQAVLRRNIADSFTNLGRRNQNLLSRQLDFITQLEANETEPDTLAALFRLDHLATRMRRNAESLLVLAGIGPPRRWAAPVAIVDVIRAAFGEVETYERATVRDVEPAMVMGAAAADLAHLLAELLENALTFSPPDKEVEVRGRRRDDGHYTVAIIDAGFGMPEDELAQANRRLAGTESFTVAPSKYLGHYVAGNLAARHGIEIRLSPAPGQGITALVALPPALLAADTASPGALDGGVGALGRLGPGGRPSGGSGARPAGGPVGSAGGFGGGPSGPAGGPAVGVTPAPAASAPGPSGGFAGGQAGGAGAGQAGGIVPGGVVPGGAGPGGPAPGWSEQPAAHAAPGTGWSGEPGPWGSSPPRQASSSAATGPAAAPPGGPWAGQAPASELPTGPVPAAGPPAATGATPGVTPAGTSGVSWADALAPLQPGVGGALARPGGPRGAAHVAGSGESGATAGHAHTNPAYGRHRDYRSAASPAALPAPASGGAGGGDHLAGAAPFLGRSGPEDAAPPGQGPVGAAPWSPGQPAPAMPGAPGSPPATEWWAGTAPRRQAPASAPTAGAPLAPLADDRAPADAAPGPGGSRPPLPARRPGGGTGWAGGPGAVPGPEHRAAPAGAGPLGDAARVGADAAALADPLGDVPSRPMWAALADLRTARPITRPTGVVGDPGSGGLTASGLTRRVSGAQLPSTRPRAIRRVSPEPPAPRSSGRLAGEPEGHGTPSAGPGDRHGHSGDAGIEAAAGNVYDFLSRFSEGVKRGLADAERSDRP
jgi:signal transduction histidine kinase